MSNANEAEVPPLLPWFRSALKDWSIVGMNHYVVTTSMYLGIEERWLYVAMTKDNLCIKAQHRDELRVWDDLEIKALEAARDAALSAGKGGKGDG